MMNFCQLWNHMDGEPYHEVPPPVNYKLASFADQISSGPVGGHELRPLTHEDMCQASEKDVADAYVRLHKGRSPSKLGRPMTDAEFRAFFGQTW